MRISLDEGSGPVAVLLHGQPGTATDFDRVVGALRGKGLRVLAVDRPGYHGEPGRATGFVGNATALDALLRETLPPDEQVLLLGLSWGGGVALAYVQAHPERVRALLLAASVGAPQSVSAIDRVMALPVMAAIAQRTLPHLSWLVESSSGSHLTPADRAFARQAALSWAGIGGWLAFRAEQKALVGELQQLWEGVTVPPFPVTVVQGTRDGYVPAPAGRALAARMQARYVEVPVGHLLHLEVPALLASELLALTVAA